VAPLMGHYTTMLRRYIVSDSETAKLCQQIYQKHQRALDLIYEHRPDVQMRLMEVLKELIGKGAPAFGLALDDSVKSYVRFAVADWDWLPGQRAGSGWTASKRILLFVLNNSPSGLSLGLHIGPGPDAVRQALWECAEEHLGVFNKRKRAGKWWQIYERLILGEQDYTDLNLEELKAKLRVEWSSFLDRDLPAIHEAVAGAQWPESPGSRGM
jgi:hypothetical protein